MVMSVELPRLIEESLKLSLEKDMCVTYVTLEYFEMVAENFQLLELFIIHTLHLVPQSLSQLYKSLLSKTELSNFLITVVLPLLNLTFEIV